MELMPCQLCGVEPNGYAVDNGGLALFSCDCKGSGCFNEKSERQVSEAELHWNRMQTLIARGLLLEAVDSETITTTRRL